MEEEIRDGQNAGAAQGEAQKKATKSKRDMTLERLKARHPEAQYDDDEAMYGAINDDYDADQKSIEGYKASEKALADMFSADPRSATFMQSMKKGANPWVEIVKQFGDEALDYLADPDNADELASAQQEYLKNVTEGNKLSEEYDKNLESSLKVLDEFEQEFGEELTNNLVSKLFVVANDVIRGKITKEALTMLKMAESHDSDVEDAAHAAEVKGRNANITKNIRLKKKDDGTPELGSSNEAATRHGDDMPDIGALARPKQNIWERGNEKRIKMR